MTDRKSLRANSRRAGVRARIEMAMQAGADWVQIREKDMPGRELLELARDAVHAAETLRRAAGAVAAGRAEEERASPRVIVNDRLDVALAAGAAGAHLGRESVNAREVVAWCRSGNAPAGFLVGVSCHSLEQAREAERAGASYIFFGPVFDTPAKREYGEPQGVARLSEICGSARIPVMAIGGVDAVNARECIRAGAAGIAAIRMFQEERALPDAVRKIRRSAL